MKKIIRNSFLVIVVLIIASYLYADVYEKTSITPIDDTVNSILEVVNREEFINAYNKEYNDDSIDEVNKSVASLSLLKSKIILGPYFVLIALSSYLSNAIMIYLVSVIDHKVHKSTHRLRFVEVIDITFFGIYVYSLKYMLMLLYVKITKSLTIYCIPIEIILASLPVIYPYYQTIVTERKEQDNHGYPYIAACIISELFLVATVIL